MPWCADLVTWWETINWGSAPDWLAAVGTVGTLAFSLVLLGLDRRRQRRSEADGVKLRHTVTSLAGTMQLNVFLYNANPHRIQLAVIRYWDGSLWKTKHIQTMPGDFGLAPGVESTATVPFLANFKSRSYYIEVFDSLGRAWARRLSGTPLSARAIKRWNKRGRWKRFVARLSALRIGALRRLSDVRKAFAAAWRWLRARR